MRLRFISLVIASSLGLAFAAPVLADSHEAAPAPEAAEAAAEVAEPAEASAPSSAAPAAGEDPVADAETADSTPLPPAQTVETDRYDQALEYTAIGIDVLVLRPLSFAAVAVGAPMFLAAAPFSAIDGKLGAAYDVFLQVPIDYAWWRPLGDL